MGAAAFIGYLLLAGGPPLVIWCTFIANKSFLVLLGLASSFYWLVVLLVTSLLFRAFVPLPEHALMYALTLIIAVTIQDAARYGAYVINQILLQGLHTMSQDGQSEKITEKDKLSLALTHGMGHAIAQTSFLYFSWVSLSSGKGTLYLDICPQMSYFLAAGLLTLAFFMLHCFSMVIAFYGWDKNLRTLPISVGILHYIAALTTVFNMIHRACIPVTILALIEGFLALVGAILVCCHQSSRNYEALENSEELSGS